MPRLMSVAMTVDAVRGRRKRVTRRAGWTFLRKGDVVTLCPKVQGRRPGQPLERLVDVEIVDVHPEPLGLMLPSWGRPNYGAQEVALEGFPGMDPAEFVRQYFTEPQGLGEDDSVNRIEWRYLEPAAATIEAAVRAHRFLYADEIGLHEGLEQVFAAAGLEARREVSLNPSGRIDFLIENDQGRTGVEVKVAGSADVVTRQLARYAGHVDDLVLITTKARHRNVPDSIDGTPVRKVHVRGSAW